VDVHIGYCRQAARTVAKRHGVRRPPVDVRGIAATEGLRVVSAHIGVLDARLYRDGGEWVLELNPAYAETAQRFSVAHEIGHLVLAHDGCGSHPEDERAANVFAAELLMPLEMVKSGLRETTRLGELAQRFGVSRDAMRIKLDEQHLLLRLTSFD
jgi:Zn-dependent peptidase ImmA (M78 family)